MHGIGLMNHLLIVVITFRAVSVSVVVPEARRRCSSWAKCKFLLLNDVQLGT